MADQTREARERAQAIIQKIQEHRPTSSSQLIGFIALLTTFGILLFLGGLTVTGIIITLVLLTPVLLFFSPILVPAGFVLFIGIAGLVAVSAGVVFTVSVVSWIYNYFQGRRPPGAEHIDYARMRIQETAEQARHKARDLTGTLQRKTQEAAPGA